MKKYFTHHYAQLNKIDPYSDKSIIDFLEQCKEYYKLDFGDYIKELSKCKILEIGCSIGGFINFLFSNNIKDVTGVDISNDHISICKKFVTKNVVRSDAVKYLKNNKIKFDCIVAIDFIEHLSKKTIPYFLQLVYKSLKDDGKFILRTPNMGSIFGLHSRYIDFTHEVGFTEESIIQILKNTGFKSVRINNAYIGRKRLFAIKLFQKMISKLYNVELPNIVTKNMVAIAEK